MQIVSNSTPESLISADKLASWHCKKGQSGRDNLIDADTGGYSSHLRGDLSSTAVVLERMVTNLNELN
jgi:hypothetical protein